MVDGSNRTSGAKLYRQLASVGQLLVCGAPTVVVLTLLPSMVMREQFVAVLVFPTGVFVRIIGSHGRSRSHENPERDVP